VASLTETLQVALVVEILNVAIMACDVYASRHDVVDHADCTIATMLAEFVTEPDAQTYCIPASCEVECSEWIVAVAESVVGSTGVKAGVLCLMFGTVTLVAFYDGAAAMFTA
jgi:hypothetical protein